MNKKEMIKAIYEKIADKTLSFWCKIELLDGAIVEYITDVDDWWPWINENIDWEYGIYVYNHNRDSSIQFEWFGDIGYSEKLKERFFNKHRYIKKVIWHPVMINRVEYVLLKNDYLEVRKTISKEELLLSIDEWNIEAINLLYKKVWL